MEVLRCRITCAVIISCAFCLMKQVGRASCCDDPVVAREVGGYALRRVGRDLFRHCYP
jgi:hypothetical protein